MHICLVLRLFICPAPAGAASTDTAVSTASVTGHTIPLFGNTAVIKDPQQPAPFELVKESPAEFKGSGPKPVKKKKKPAAPARPPEKKAETKPPKRKLVPVSFYDKWESRRVNCEWFLGKVFIPAYEGEPAQDLKWRPAPPPPTLEYGYWRTHQQPAPVPRRGPKIRLD